MKIKIGIYSLFFLLLIMATSCASRKFTYFQTKEARKGKVVDIPSLRNKNFVRFQPDDILGITVNVPGEQSIAIDYNLPLIPSATTENSSDQISQGVGRQTFLVRKDGTIDFPVIGIIKVEGYTQEELEKYLKKLLSEKIMIPTIVTVRLLNFTIWLTGEVGNGQFTVNRDHINLLEALALAGDMTLYGKRDDIRLIRQKPDGSYTAISLDISNENIISSPYYFLQQNDVIYVMPVKAKAQSADISPMLNVTMGITTFAITLVTFVLMLGKK